ncbi:MAG: cytidylate kinase-like family protein [Eubacteriales bacterium]|nr:cytidylate kinase-like family protein [Eubacteriales bacterium]
MRQTDCIVTIGRSCGSGGRTIGRMVAEKLHIPYYDSELLEEAARASGLSQKYLESIDEKPTRSAALYRSVGFGTAAYPGLEQVARKAQREIIETIAERGPCVIVGRRADQILKENHELIRIFITASKGSRIAHIVERESMSERDARRRVSKVDRERASYYHQYSDQKWGYAETYDSCFNTDVLGKENVADAIVELVLAKDNS